MCLKYNFLAPLYAPKAPHVITLQFARWFWSILRTAGRRPHTQGDARHLQSASRIQQYIGNTICSGLNPENLSGYSSSFRFVEQMILTSKH